MFIRVLCLLIIHFNFHLPFGAELWGVLSYYRILFTISYINTKIIIYPKHNLSFKQLF